MFRAMVITDLDGTLLQDDRTMSDRNRDTLFELEKQSICRVIATGRNLYSVNKVLPPDFPIDYLIFSTGAGIMHWPSKTIEKKHHLYRDNIREVATFLEQNSFDFMIHHPIPANHYFHYYMINDHNPDFLSRIDIYNDYAVKLEVGDYPLDSASQILAIEPVHNGHERIDFIYSNITEVTVIRTTSPLDKRSLWIEFFSNSASKSRGGAFLAQKFGITTDKVLSIGNDFNDVDMLDWAGTSFVVSNAALELRRRYAQVESNNDGGFSQAVWAWYSGKAKRNSLDMQR